MCSSITGPSKPKNILTCENCNKQILFYQERICNSGGKIPYGQDGKLHRCLNEPADKELRCSCQRSIQQHWESEPNHIQISEFVTPMHSVVELKTKMRIVVLDCVYQLLNYLHHEKEKSRDKGGV
jgi:hypothetical protein